MSEPISPSRLPWVAASTVPFGASLAVFLLGKYVFFPLSATPGSNVWFAALYEDADFAVGLGVPVFVGLLLRLRYEYPSKGIFLTCAASTYAMVLAEFLALFGTSPGSTPFDLLWSFPAAAFWAVLGALLIVAGSALGRRAVARRQVRAASLPGVVE